VRLEEIGESVAVALHVLRMAAVCQPTQRPQEADSRTLKPHTSTCRGSGSTHRLSKFLFKKGIVEPICSVDEKVPGMISTQKVVDDLLTRIRYVPGGISIERSRFFFPENRH
jgi:hypothetical protein